MKKTFAALLCLALFSVPSICAAGGSYILGVQHGLIAYYDPAADNWTQTTCPLDALPNAQDRRVLSSGLSMDSRAALTRALEDYCS